MIKKRLFNFFIFLILLGSGCGSSSGNGDGSSGGGSTPQAGTGSGDAVQDVLTSWDSTAEIVSTALSVDVPSAIVIKRLAAGAVSQHVHCTTGGPANVDGTITGDSSSGSFNFTSGMNNCFGLDGTLSFSGSYELVDTNYNFTVSFTGDAGGNGCLITFDQLSYSFTTPSDIITAPTSEAVEGLVTSDCTETNGSAAVSCEWAAGVNSLNLSELEAGCTCSGNGCS